MILNGHGYVRNIHIPVRPRPTERWTGLTHLAWLDRARVRSPRAITFDELGMSGKHVPCEMRMWLWMLSIREHSWWRMITVGTRWLGDPWVFIGMSEWSSDIGSVLFSFVFSPLWWMIFFFGGKLYPAHSSCWFFFPLALVLFRYVDSASGCSCLLILSWSCFWMLLSPLVPFVCLTGSHCAVYNNPCSLLCGCLLSWIPVSACFFSCLYRAKPDAVNNYCESIRADTIETFFSISLWL